jgi:CrcB protein
VMEEPPTRTAAAPPISPAKVAREAEAEADRRSHPLPSTRLLAAIGAAGALGALARYGVSLSMPEGTRSFPWATFAVNVGGCVLLGLALTWLGLRRTMSPLLRAVIVTGFIGAFTTFSTYVVSVDLLVRAHADVTAAAFALGSVAAGGAAVVIGVVSGRMLSASTADQRAPRDSR